LIQRAALVRVDLGKAQRKVEELGARKRALKLVDYAVRRQRLFVFERKKMT